MRGIISINFIPTTDDDYADDEAAKVEGEQEEGVTWNGSQEFNYRPGGGNLSSSSIKHPLFKMHAIIAVCPTKENP